MRLSPKSKEKCAESRKNIGSNARESDGTLLGNNFSCKTNAS
jgi:hypothetical protein